MCSALTLAWHAFAYAVTSVLHMCDVDWLLDINYHRIQADYNESLVKFTGLISVAVESPCQTNNRDLESGILLGAVNNPDETFYQLL